MRYLLTIILVINHLIVFSQSEQDTLCTCYKERINTSMYTKYCFFSDNRFTFEHWGFMYIGLKGEYKKDGNILILNSRYCEDEKTEEFFYGSKDSVYIFFSESPGVILIYRGGDTSQVFVNDTIMAIPNNPQYQQGIIFFLYRRKEIPIKFNSKDHNSMMIKICQPFQGILRFKNFRVIMKKNMLIVPKTEGVTLRKSILQKVVP